MRMADSVVMLVVVGVMVFVAVGVRVGMPVIMTVVMAVAVPMIVAMVMSTRLAGRMVVSAGLGGARPGLFFDERLYARGKVNYRFGRKKIDIGQRPQSRGL